MATPSLKVCIVGGVAAGMTTAVRLRRLREDIDISVFEKGPDLSIASCGLPFYIGGEITDRKKMALVTVQWAKNRHNINAHVMSEVVSIDRTGKSISVKDLQTGAISVHTYDKLVLAPGAAPVTGGISGATLPGVYTLRSLSDMDRLTVEAVGMKRAVVIGGGFVGIEVVENLHKKGVAVTVVELAPHVLPMFDPEMVVPIEAAMENAGVCLKLGRKTTAIKEVGAGTPNRMLSVGLDDGTEIAADFVLLSIGVAPESSLARAVGLNLGVNNTIAVNNRMQTSDPDIYAAGDVVQSHNLITNGPMMLAMAGPAIRQARVIAANIAGHGNETFAGVNGTSVVNAFGITCALSGVSERFAKRCNLPDVSKIYICQPTKVDWFPKSTPTLLKMLYNNKDGRLLGLQITGREGIEKRADVFSIALQAGFTVRQLAQFEPAYAPQFNGPKDPLNIASFAACNFLDGLSKICFADALPENCLILDVREEPELKLQGTVPGALHIPSGALRGRLAELPKDRPIAVMCKVGARGNHVMRMLTQNGFNAFNLSGGIMVYNLFNNPAAYRAWATNGVF